MYEVELGLVINTKPTIEEVLKMEVVDEDSDYPTVYYDGEKYWCIENGVVYRLMPIRKIGLWVRMA